MTQENVKKNTRRKVVVEEGEIEEIVKVAKCKVFNCEHLNLRSAPDFKASILAVLKKDTVLELLDTHKDWVEVKMLDYQKLVGFCHKDFIENVD